jgi:hypothetical protein
LYDQEVERLGKFGWRDDDGSWQEAGELGEAMLNHYVETYGKDDLWRVLVTEQRFQVPILNRRKRQIGIYTGIMDLVMQNRSDKRIQVWDHKTAASINTGYLILDEQASAYWTFGVEWLYANGLLKPDQKLWGMMFNFLRKAAKDERPRNDDGHYLNKPEKKPLLEVFKREGRTVPKGATVDDLIAILGDRALLLGEISKTQPAKYFHREPVWRDEYDRQQVRRRVLDEMRDMTAVMDPANPTSAYKNPSQMNCPGCGYRDVCELHEAGQDWKEMVKHTMETWKPFDWVEIEAAELK